MQIHRRLGVRILGLRRSGVKGVVLISRMDCGRDREDVVVGAVVDGARKSGVAADELGVGDGQDRTLDVVLVAEGAVEDGRVEGLRHLLDNRAVE